MFRLQPLPCAPPSPQQPTRCPTGCLLDSTGLTLYHWCGVVFVPPSGKDPPAPLGQSFHSLSNMTAADPSRVEIRSYYPLIKPPGGSLPTCPFPTSVLLLNIFQPHSPLLSQEHAKCVCSPILGPFLNLISLFTSSPKHPGREAWLNFKITPTPSCHSSFPSPAMSLYDTSE